MMFSPKNNVFEDDTYIYIAQIVLHATRSRNSTYEQIAI